MQLNVAFIFGETAHEAGQIQQAVNGQVVIGRARSDIESAVLALAKGDPGPGGGVRDDGPRRGPRNRAFDPHLR